MKRKVTRSVSKWVRGDAQDSGGGDCVGILIGTPELVDQAERYIVMNPPRAGRSDARAVPISRARVAESGTRSVGSVIAPPKAFSGSVDSVGKMVDLRTEIAGVRLRNPTMLASGFLDETGGSMARVYQAGAGAVVTKSVGPEPREGYPNPTIVELDAGLLNAVGLPNPGVVEYEHEVRRALTAGAVVIGSVYGKDADEYASVAARMATYGVKAIELNFSCPHAKGLGTEIAQHEDAVRDFTRAVKDVVSLPVWPKLSPNVQDIATFALAAEEGGADGIVAINTLKAMAITPELKMPSLANRYGGLSGPAIRPIGVRAVYDICEKVRIPVIGVGGIGSGRDALEYIMAGASAVQVGTAIISKGLGVFDAIAKEMASLLEEAGFASVPEAIGVAHA